MSTINKRAGETVRTWRERRKLTQAELADRAGIAKRTVERVEVGAVSPRLDTLAKLAGPLGLTVDGLLREIATPYDGSFWGEK